MSKTFCKFNYFKAQLPSSCWSIVLKCWHLSQATIAVAFIISFGVEVANNYYGVTNNKYCGFDDTLVQKAKKTVMDLAANNFNISLFMNPGRHPPTAIITGKEVNMNLGPVISNTATLTPSSFLGHPFLAKLEINDFWRRKCFTTTIPVYSNTRVIPIDEEEEHVVFISNYRHRVGSILTFQPLEQDNNPDLERLKKTSSNIGFHGDFLWSYFDDLGFRKQRIYNGSSKYKYEGEFRSIDSADAFLEIPRGNVIHGKRWKQFTAITPYYSFRDSSFVFKKDSEIVTNISRAFMNLCEQYEYSIIGDVEGGYECILAAASFSGIFLIYGTISTVCLLVFLINLVKSYCSDQDENESNLSPC